LLYGLATLAGLLSLIVSGLSVDISLAAILAFSLMLTLIGIYLGQVRIYDEKELAAASENQSSPSFSRFLISDGSLSLAGSVTRPAVIPLGIQYNPRSLEDAVTWDRFIRSLPLVVSVKIVALLAVGVYRGLWKYISLDDVIVYAKGVALGSMASMIVLLLVYDLKDTPVWCLHWMVFYCWFYSPAVV